MEAEMGKVTVSGDVEPETLIRTLKKNGKHVELIELVTPRKIMACGLRTVKVRKGRRGAKAALSTHLPLPYVASFLNLDSCEKIGVEGEHAGVVEFIRKGSGDESHNVFVLEADICSIVKKDVKKEEDIDVNIFSYLQKDVKKEKGYLGQPMMVIRIGGTVPGAVMLGVSKKLKAQSSKLHPRPWCKTFSLMKQPR
nr:B3 domain-containing protein At5g60130-like isoform X1 [Ipomoea trifida]